MTFSLSILLLVLTSFTCVFVVVEYRRVLALALAILVSVCGYNSYLSHKEVLGLPVNMTWEEMPSKFTVNFFRIVGKDAIILWLVPDQLVKLPFDPNAQESLEGERDSMGEGQPSTFEEGGGGEGQQGDGSADGDGQGDGSGENDGEEEGSGQGGWHYELKGRGNMAIPGNLPPK